MDTYISHVLLGSKKHHRGDVGKKRSHDTIEPDAVAEPAWKRLALSSGLPAICQDAEASCDVEMEESVSFHHISHGIKVIHSYTQLTQISQLPASLLKVVLTACRFPKALGVQMKQTASRPL